MFLFNGSVNVLINCSITYLNTTFVSLQHIFYLWFFYLQLFKYNFCFSSTFIKNARRWHCEIFKYNFCFSSTVISVIPNSFLYWFKYNFCFSSTYFMFERTLESEEFKYNFCFSSTEQVEKYLLILQLFKYNFCFSSTVILLVIFIIKIYLNTTFVSLQPKKVEHPGQN